MWVPCNPVSIILGARTCRQARSVHETRRRKISEVEVQSKKASTQTSGAFNHRPFLNNNKIWCSDNYENVLQTLFQKPCISHIQKFESLLSTRIQRLTAGDLLDYTDKYILPSLAALIIYSFASCDGRWRKISGKYRSDPIIETDISLLSETSSRRPWHVFVSIKTSFRSEEKKLSEPAERRGIFLLNSNFVTSHSQI